MNLSHLIWMQDVVPMLCIFLFFLILYGHILFQPDIFTKRHGRKHSVTGFLYLTWITLGFLTIYLPHNSIFYPLIDWLTYYHYLIFDIGLGILGIKLTLFAAYEFKHKNVKNVASGTLDMHATVTYDEMIEHSFYQILNLIQIIFLHCFVSSNSSLSNEPQTNHHRSWGLIYRLFFLFLVTIPWYFRQRYPINHFSDNYNKIDPQSTMFIRILYRIKKYQYVFYKHFLLHGLNITIAIYDISLINKHYFRLYWLCLNLSYVMEFFLQTLVKKAYLSQQMMLFMQQILMFASTFVAIQVLSHIHWGIAMLSLICNFMNRKHDVLNTSCIVLLCCLYLYETKQLIF